MVGKTRIITLLACICLTFSLQGQDYTRHNWYFTNNDQALVFGKEPDTMPFLDEGKVAQANVGEKLTATDPISGDLMFYSDGINIYDATHQIMENGDGIVSDAAGIQAMSVSPVPGAGSESLYYLIHRDDAGNILYTVVDMSIPGNRTDGPPAGAVRAGQKNAPTGITDRGDGMTTIASADLSDFWLVTQNSTNNLFELYSIPPFAPGGATFTADGMNMNLTADVTAMHISYHPGNGQLAIVPSNNANIQIVDFNESVPELVPSDPITNSFASGQSFGGSASWSMDGTKFFFSRNTGTNGNLYRIDLSDPLASVEPVFGTPVAESLSLMLAPDSTVYHIYRDAAGGSRLLGRINEPDSALADLEYETALFEAQDLGSNYFAQFVPERNLMPTVTISVQSGEICPENPVQFFADINPPTAIPEDFFWDFQPTGQVSQQQAPIMTFTDPGMLAVNLTVTINGRPVPSNTLMAEITQSQLEVSLSDTTICPGETLELDATPQDGGMGGGGGGGSYEYLWNTGEETAMISVTEAGNYWVVVTPDTGCPVYATAAVEVYGDENPTANIWYFGNGAGIDFNEEDDLPPPPRSITVAHAMDAPEGTSTISDPNGDVLFYSDGRSVWNRFNDRMPNGDMIGGDSTSTQAVLIVPFTEDETLYYVFTTQEVYGENTFLLKYSVIDMKEDNGRGDVIEKDVTLFARSTEKLIAYEGGNGFWVVAHEYGNNTFRAYPITSEGIGTPVLSSEGSVHSLNDAFSGQAGMKFSADGSRIAVALIEGSDDFVELFQFDQGTGEITEFEYQIDLNEGGGSTNDQVYDVHFSSGGTKLFASMNNRNLGSPGGRILEYRVDTLSTEDTRLASRTDIAQGSGLNANIGAMQTGPDGQIYVAVEVPGSPASSAFVGSIAANEDTATSSGFNPQQVLLDVGNSRLGLPNFVQNNSTPQDQPSFAVQDTTCTEQRLELTGSGTSDLDMYAWTITHEATNATVFSVVSDEPDTVHIFPEGSTPGRYNVSLNIFNRCGFDTTFVQPVEVFDTPDPPTIPSAMAICEGESSLLNANALNEPGLSFVWTNSQGTVVGTNAEFTVTEPEIYTVTVTNAGGCTNSGEVFAGPPFEISLPPTQTICQDAELTLDPLVTADVYRWTMINPDNTSQQVGTEQRITVDSSVPGVFTYVVSIEDPITPGCFVNDSTVVTVNALPQLTLGTVNGAACGASDGDFEFSVTTTGNYAYQVRDNSGNLVQPLTNIDGPGTTSVTGLAAGLYTVEISDIGSACTNTLDNITIENTPPDFTIDAIAETAADCTNPNGAFTVTLSADIFPITYTLTNTSDGNVLSATIMSANAGTTFDFDIPNVPAGFYDLEVTSQGGCTQTMTDQEVTRPADIEITTEPFVDVCAASAPLAITSANLPGATFTWTGPGGFNQVGGNLTTTVSGTYTVTATDPANVLCSTSETVVVNLAIQPVVTINNLGDECTGTVTLQAEVTNSQPGVTYVYNWSTGATGPSIEVSASGTYDVTVRESTNLTCTGTASETVTIPEPLVVNLTSTPPCEYEETDPRRAITLTANVTSGTATGFSWFLNGNSIPGSSSEITVFDEGNYSVTVNAGTCTESASLEIRRFSIPNSLLPERALYCPTSTPTIVQAGRFFVSYEWTLNGQPFADAGEDLEINAPGTYQVTMTTAQGCQRIATMEVIESCDPVVIAPSALIPSSNPPNNTFQVLPNDFVNDFEISIYSRWGELIFQSNSITFQWDGTVNGELVPLGTYPYIIRFTSLFEPERGVFEQYGSVTVIK